MSSNNDIWPFSQGLGIKHAEGRFPIIVHMRRYANGHPWNSGVMELYVQRQSTHSAQLIKYFAVGTSQCSGFNHWFIFCSGMITEARVEDKQPGKHLHTTGSLCTETTQPHHPALSPVIWWVDFSTVYKQIMFYHSDDAAVMCTYVTQHFLHV